MATPETTPELDVQTVEDWQEENRIDWEKRYKDLQAEYTRKTQEDAKKTTTYQDEWDNSEAWKQWIKENVLEPELEKLKGNLESERQFEELLDANPQLKKNEKAIKEIAELKWLRYDEVIEEYWFGSLDKLAKAKERSLIGDRWLIDGKQKSILSLQWAEREERKKQYATWDWLTDAKWF